MSTKTKPEERARHFPGGNAPGSGGKGQQMKGSRSPEPRLTRRPILNGTEQWSVLFPTVRLVNLVSLGYIQSDGRLTVRPEMGRDCCCLSRVGGTSAQPTHTC